MHLEITFSDDTGINIDTGKNVYKITFNYYSISILIKRYTAESIVGSIIEHICNNKENFERIVTDILLELANNAFKGPLKRAVIDDLTNHTMHSDFINFSLKNKVDNNNISIITALYRSSLDVDISVYRPYIKIYSARNIRTNYNADIVVRLLKAAKMYIAGERTREADVIVKDIIRQIAHEASKIGWPFALHLYRQNNIINVENELVREIRKRKSYLKNMKTYRCKARYAEELLNRGVPLIFTKDINYDILYSGSLILVDPSLVLSLF